MPSMEKAAIRRWRRDIFRMLKAIDPQWNPGHPSFAGAMLLVAIAAVGTDPSTLQELTGYSTTFITKVLRRARKAKLLVGQSLRVEWFSKRQDVGAAALIADALVVSEPITRVPDPKRSAAARARAATRTPGRVRHQPTPISPGAVFSPKIVQSKPLYLHEQYLTKEKDFR